MAARVACVLALALLACRSDASTSAPVTVQSGSGSAAAAAPSGVDAELLRTLAIVATRKVPSPDELAATKRALDGGKLAMASYITTLVDSTQFAEDVAPVILFRGLLTMNNQIGGYVMKHTDDAVPIYYLHEPCKVGTAVSVRPWWSLDAPIKVCPNSYKPKQWTGTSKPGAPKFACQSFFGRGSDCGCGPNLVRCFPSREAYFAFNADMRDEVRLTVSHVVGANQPLDAIFTANETWRTRQAETYRRMQMIEAKQIANPEPMLRELAAWPAEGKWAARDDLAPGQNAGLLTSPQLINFFPDRRQRMTTLYDVLWCDEPSSAGATPELVSKIAGASASFQLTTDHWKELAARPICTECHARLDYGLQFFQGFDNSDLHAYYAPALQLAKRGPLYAQNVDDPRGEDSLAPAGFARLAVAAPEHAKCMARDFAEYALGSRATVDGIAKLAAAVKPNATTARELMRAALLQLVEEWPHLDVAPKPAPAAAAQVTTGALAIGKDLHDRIETTCGDCHHGDANVPDFSGATLPRTTVIDMLDAVAFGAMPRNHAMPTAERAAWVEPLIAAMWSGGDAVAARDYYIGRRQSLPAYRPEVIFSLIHQRTGGSPMPWRMMERSTRPALQQASPGMITAASLEAIEACKRAKKTRAEIDACISDTLRIEDIAVTHR